MAKRRRGRGEGGVEQLPSGSWRAVTPARTDPATGKRVRASKTFPAKSEALAWLAAQVAAPKPVASGTVGEWLTEWLTRHRARTGAGNYRADERAVRRTIRPAMGAKRLRDLDRRAVADFLAGVQGTAATRHAVGRTLRKILNAAVAAGRIPASPLAGVPLAPKPESDTRPFSLPELAEFLAVADRLGWGPLTRVWADTGLRPSELIALQWGDYDPAAGVLRISRASDPETGRLKEPKSRAGRRILHLSAPARAALDSIRPKNPAPPAPIFHAEDGRAPWRYSGFTKTVWRPIRAALPERLRWATPYTLRHTMASVLLSGGVNLKVIAQRMGHADVSLTLRVYGHLMPGDQERAADYLGGLLPTVLPTPDKKP